jgi:hypothetical protein
MRSTTTKLSLAAIVMAGLIIPLVLQRQHLTQLRAENTALRQQTAELAALQARNQRPANQSSDAEVSARSQRERQELVRLRGEVARLRKGLAQSTSREPAVQSSTAPGQPGTNDQTFPLRCTATATATVRTGDSFATGGWLTSPGTRTFFLATPTLRQGDSGARMIDIPTILMKVPEADLPDTLRKKLETQPTGASPVLTGTELDVLMAALKSGQGSNVVSRPRITTGDDGEASLMVGQTSAVLKNPDGTPVFTGTELRMLPRIKDGEMIEVGVNLKYDVPSDALDDDPAPPGQ